MTTWTPDPASVLWGRQLLQLIAEGGTWLYPGAEQIWKISHLQRTITIQAGPFTAFSEEQVSRTRVLFETVFDYKVIDQRTRPDETNPNPN